MGGAVFLFELFVELFSQVCVLFLVVLNYYPICTFQSRQVSALSPTVVGVEILVFISTLQQTFLPLVSFHTTEVMLMWSI